MIVIVGNVVVTGGAGLVWWRAPQLFAGGDHIVRG